MNTYDFIFSNQTTYRIFRHVCFWLFWTIFWVTTYAVPNYTIPSWNIPEWRARVGDVPLLSTIVKAFFNSWFRAMSLYMAFTYFIVYFLLPKYFLRKKKSWYVPFISILFFATIFGLLYYFSYLSFEMAVREGRRAFLPDNTYMVVVTVKSFLYNFPTAAGIAVGIKLLKRWWLKQKETEQLSREKAKAELQLLKGQIHPHFLFNTLNNIYFFTLSSSHQAPEMIKKLSDLLRYILNECNQSAVPLAKEIKMIQDYMSLEKIRYGDQMDMDITVAGDYHLKTIAPLLLIPFVENSFKHGASKMLDSSFVRLCITVEENDLSFLLSNNQPLSSTPSGHKKSIGLKNVKKRLQLLYPGTHELNIVSNPEIFTVFMKINLQKIKGLVSQIEEKNEITDAVA